MAERSHGSRTAAEDWNKADIKPEASQPKPEASQLTTDTGQPTPEPGARPGRAARGSRVLRAGAAHIRPGLARAGHLVLAGAHIGAVAVLAFAHTLAEHRVGRRVLMGLALLVVTLFGVSIGLLLGGRTSQDVGPFSATFSITPSLSGGTDVEIPPLGSLHLRSHQGPAHLTVQLNSLDPKRTQALLSDPNGIAYASESAVTDVERGVTKLVLQAAGAAVLGTLLLSTLIFRNTRRVAVCGGLSLVTIAAGAGIAFGTFRPASVEEPTYHGLLTKAPAVVGDARRIANQFGQYRDELQRLVSNMSRLYATFSNLPVYEPASETIRVLHISDLHLNPAAWSVIETVVKQFNIDLVVDTGDINDWGTPMESSFVDPIASLKVPYVYIRGNHDSPLTAQAVGRQPNTTVLENSMVSIHGLTIAGIGDPRFTPDKQTESNDPNSSHQQVATVYGSAESLASTIRDSGRKVDIALIHDPAGAGALAGVVPLVLAGHVHTEQAETLPAPPGQEPTFVQIEGSTGGAGLRGLEGKTPTPLEMSVLYFDPGGKLQAYDNIVIGGAGRTDVTLNRHTLSDLTGSASPSPSDSSSAGTSPGP